MLRNKGKLWFWAGLCAVLFLMVPGLLLGENAVYTYHDQLDGEVIAYLLQARHLFQGDILPEFMNGASKTALTMPAPGCVLLFLGGNGLAGLTWMMVLGHVVGYVGMYLLVREFTDRAWIGMLAGGLYGYLPFLPVYGLSQFGIPLLFWCALQLGKGKHKILAYCYTALYTLCSSLVLVGFGLLGMGVLWLLWQFVESRQKGRERKNLYHVLAAWQLMLVLYVVINFRLLGQMLGLGGMEVSHKAEYVLTATPFWNSFWQGVTKGGQHSIDYHGFLLVLTLLVALAGFLQKRKRSASRVSSGEKKISCAEKEVFLADRLAGTICKCICWNLLFSFAAAVWDSGLGVKMRSGLSALGAFQLERLLWISPTLWYLAFGCSLALAVEIWKDILVCQKGKLIRLLSLGWGMVTGIVVCATGIRILLSGDIKSNFQKLRNSDYGLMSFGDYYGLGVMEQVEAFLLEETGREMADYRVVSLGIDPAAALYHGFYCLDGYSNNYSLEYKHQFRRILAPELEKSEYLRGYFDDWGNRCYLFSSECPGYYTIEKGGFVFQNYELDVQALKELGGDYLFSAAYILNAEEQGLVLMREEAFETEESYYRIYVYEIGEV